MTLKIAERITDTHVYFWGGVFSNWYKSKFVAFLKCNVNTSYEFNCVEQYIMASKALMFEDRECFEKIMKSSNPKEQKELGRSVKNYDDKKWCSERSMIAFTGILEKFSQNLNIKKILLDTNDKILVEASPYDKVWGVGLHWSDDLILDQTNWKGLNLLGNVLMSVRESYK